MLSRNVKAIFYVQWFKDHAGHAGKDVEPIEFVNFRNAGWICWVKVELINYVSNYFKTTVANPARNAKRKSSKKLRSQSTANYLNSASFNKCKRKQFEICPRLAYNARGFTLCRNIDIQMFVRGVTCQRLRRTTNVQQRFEVDGLQSTGIAWSRCCTSGRASLWIYLKVVSCLEIIVSWPPSRKWGFLAARGWEVCNVQRINTVCILKTDN